MDRKVEGQAKAVLFKGSTAPAQSIYVIGHPCGLPLKYAPGANVSKIKKAHFSADLDIYSGNSGSPVFNKDTHEVIGIVVRGDTQDFRWTGKGWLSVIYPNSDIHSREPQCTRVSEFKNIVDPSAGGAYMLRTPWHGGPICCANRLCRFSFVSG